jgi:hypothetical protein
VYRGTRPWDGADIVFVPNAIIVRHTNAALPVRSNGAPIAGLNSCVKAAIIINYYWKNGVNWRRKIKKVEIV